MVLVGGMQLDRLGNGRCLLLEVGQELTEQKSQRDVVAVGEFGVKIGAASVVQIGLCTKTWLGPSFCGGNTKPRRFIIFLR